MTGHNIAAPLPNPTQKEGEPAVGVRCRNDFFHGKGPFVVILPIAAARKIASLRQEGARDCSAKSRRGLSVRGLVTRSPSEPAFSTQGQSEPPMFANVLIANRGEIACRIIRTARRMGIRSIAMHTPADRGALFTRLADEAHEIGEGANGYLDQGAIIALARRSAPNACIRATDSCPRTPNLQKAAPGRAWSSSVRRRRRCARWA